MHPISMIKELDPFQNEITFSPRDCGHFARMIGGRNKHPFNSCFFLERATSLDEQLLNNSFERTFTL